MNSKIINTYFDKYKSIADNISHTYGYDDNMKHLLWIIITAFIIKYGIKNESIILDCFKKTKVVIWQSNNSKVSAYFDRKLLFNGDYYTQKYIVVNANNSDKYIMYFDTIIHEFNHAVNSMKNEIKVENDTIFLRTGLSYSIYNKNSILIGEGKTNEYVLEEIINTKQTEDILNAIIGFNNLEIDDLEVSTFLKSMNSESAFEKYKSSAYLFQSYICEKLLNNKTFFSTLEKLRFDGDIENVGNWFDNIVGKKGEYNKLNNLLCKTFQLENEFSNRILFKNRIINKISKYNKMISEIINTFDNNCIYK